MKIALTILLFGLLFGGCVSTHEGMAQKETPLSRAADWEGVYANAATLPRTGFFASYLQGPPRDLRTADSIRVLISEGVIHFSALKEGLVVGQRHVSLEKDFSRIVLKHESDSGKIGHIPGQGSVNSETVLFKNEEGNIVAYERVRGALAVFYVVPVGFRNDSYAEFERKPDSP
ncbi:MAG: hypothetical protein ABIZ81_17210 [Opitutaceae bacterium]